MLYDPKWEKAPSLAGLIAWLEQQDPNQRYNFRNPWQCVLGQYAQSIGREPIQAFPDVAIALNLPLGKDGIHKAVMDMPWTFGAALARARKLSA